MNPTARTATLLTCLSVPLSLAGGYLGASLASTPTAPAPAPVVVREPAAAPADDGARVALDALQARLDGRLAALESAVGDLRLADAGALPAAAGAAPVRIAVEDVETFLALEASAARFRALRGRQSRAKLGVDRIVADATLPASARTSVDAAVDRYFDEEQRLLQVDMSELDELGRRRLEQAREDLRTRTLSELSAGIDADVARAVVDQLWLGRTPGNVVRGAEGPRSIGQGELRMPASFVPGAGARPAAR